MHQSLTSRPPSNIRCCKPRVASSTRTRWVAGRVRKSRGCQLAAVFTNIFDRSQQQAAVLPSWNLPPYSLCPNPLLSKGWIITGLWPWHWSWCEWRAWCYSMLRSIFHQFANMSKRSTDDGISITLHCVFSHIANPQTYIRMLLIDFSSASTSISPIQLI